VVTRQTERSGFLHPFAYIAPKTVKEAVSTLNKYGEKARPIAGGTDVLVQARGGRFDLDAIVDVKNIPELVQITHNAKGLTFGGAVPCYQLYENEKISAEYPGIIDAASLIGGIQIQSRAGLGGNLCNASPSADGICPLIVHSAVAHIAGPRGERTLPVEEFCVGPGKSALKKGEFLVSLELPKPVKGFGAGYERFIPRNEMDIAVVGVAASVVLDTTGKKFKSGRIALAAVGPTPIFATAASDHLAGKPVNEDTINAAAALAREAAKPISDMRGTVEQRKHLVEVLTRRMLHKAVQRALA
jgi:carbon-monoxide dehydrogenase medium subunit